MKELDVRFDFRRDVFYIKLGGVIHTLEKPDAMQFAKNFHEASVIALNKAKGIEPKTLDNEDT